MIRKMKANKQVDEEILKKGKGTIEDFDDSKEVYVDAKRPESKLISIRLPIDMIRALRQIAVLKGDIGYQQMIKTYIADGLWKETQRIQATPGRPFFVIDSSGTASNMGVVFPQEQNIVSGDYAKVA